MALGTLVGFNVQKVTTTADTNITTAGSTMGNYVVARLVAAANAATLKIYNKTTAAANEVNRLTAPANSADETSFPIRCDSTPIVQMSVNTAVAFVGVR